MNIAIIGAGRMGTTQARLARYFGDTLAFGVECDAAARKAFVDRFQVNTYDSVNQVPAALWKGLSLVWIVVCDGQIQTVAQRLAPFIAANTVVLHTSGALSSQILKDALPNHPCASLHPLMACPLPTVSDLECVNAYRNVVHSVEGDPEAVALARSIIERVEGRCVSIRSDKKVLYHAAAVFASNYPVTLLHICSSLLQHCGMDAEASADAARRLMAQAADSAQKTDFASALTGPAKRRDMNTIASHQNALAEFPDLLALYNGLLAQTLDLLDARDKGGATSQASAEK